jgi:RHH-type proline utilization regulon transcriptional repressor/proline dehydrogenase/delta 1-pyrroline-5-carboxylate dehydrogenase
VIDVMALQRIRTYIQQGEAEATLALAMPAPSPGYFVGPTVFKDVPPHGTIAQEEIFGPVLAMVKASDFDHGLTLANNTAYGLTGGLYSRTPSHIERVKTEFEVGNLYINREITGAIVSRQPFGGFKLSGVGSKAGGPDYLLQFMDPRTVTENIQRQGFAPIVGNE